MNKFTNEQLVEMKALKSMAELETFLNKENITLTDEEIAKAAQYFESGKSELGDDELDMVAGGGDKEEEYKAQALAEGRIYPAPVTLGYCGCFIKQVWARELDIERIEEVVSDGKVYNLNYHYIARDLKCYSCGAQFSVFRYSTTRSAKSKQ